MLETVRGENQVFLNYGCAYKPGIEFELPEKVTGSEVIVNPGVESEMTAVCTKII